MKKYQVNMVHPQQIVQKGLKGCKTSRSVTTFAQKNGVPWCWWKPTANQKVMLVDWTQFKTAWTKTGPTYGTTRTQTNKPATPKTATKTTSWKTRTNPTAYKAGATGKFARTTRKTTYKTTYAGRRRAA